jgi:hypothetical protein
MISVYDGLRRLYHSSVFIAASGMAVERGRERGFTLCHAPFANGAKGCGTPENRKAVACPNCKGRPPANFDPAYPNVVQRVLGGKQMIEADGVHLSKN